MKQSNLVIGIIVIVFTTGGFFGGLTYQRSKIPTYARGQFNMNLQNGQQARNRVGGEQTVGQILSLDPTTLTVKLPDGSSKIVLLTSTTTYTATTESTQSTLKVGDTIATFGRTNTDGSITAQNIQLNPLFRNAVVTGTPKNKPQHPAYLSLSILIVYNINA